MEKEEKESKKFSPQTIFYDEESLPPATGFNPKESNNSINQKTSSTNISPPNKKPYLTINTDLEPIYCNHQQSKQNKLYQAEGNSLPNFADCKLVPRSPSTNVQIDSSDINNREQDVIYSNDKFPFNDNSSNTSYASITSNSNLNAALRSKQISNGNSDQKIHQSEINSSPKSKLNDNQNQPKINDNQNQSKFNENQNQSKNRKIPKIPDIFYHSINNGNLNHKPDKFSYSWPKKKNVKPVHATSGASKRFPASPNKENKKKEVDHFKRQ